MKVREKEGEKRQNGNGEEIFRCRRKKEKTYP